MPILHPKATKNRPQLLKAKTLIEMARMNVRGDNGIKLKNPKTVFPSPRHAILYPIATSSVSMSVNPTAKRRVPTFECLPADISGMSSSTTT